MRTHVRLFGPWFNTGRRQRSPQHAGADQQHAGTDLQHAGTDLQSHRDKVETSVHTHQEFRNVHTEGHTEPFVFSQVHDRHKSSTQTHEEPHRVHTRKRACECKRDAAGPPTPSGVRTQANSLHESRLGTGGTQLRASAVPKPPITMSSIRHVLLWATHHNVINLSLNKKTKSGPPVTTSSTRRGDSDARNRSLGHPTRRQ